MKNQWNEITVTQIALVVYVAQGTGKTVHTNRQHHGFVLNDENAEKDYFFSDGTVLHTKGGDLFYLPKGSSYRVKSILEGGCYAVNFDAEIEDQPFRFRIRNQEPLLKCMKSAEKAWKTQSPSARVLAMRAVYEALHQLQVEHQRSYVPNGQFRLIDPAVEKLHAEFTHNEISVCELAALCNVSEAYFRRLFLEKFGISPKEHIIHLRIGYAKQLLESKQFSVSEVAALCGYAEPCHFSREFTKRVGISPSEYKSQTSH